SCAEPSPLVGKWSDNYDFLTLMPDMGFTFSIKDKASGEITRLEGTYAVSNNVLVFSLVEGYTILSEWDIRGSMLYLYWPNPNDNVNPIKEIILYKIGS
ncbi:MAG: hypothetical protein ACRC4W_04250, partial [Treponemataceae bacterium]